VESIAYERLVLLAFLATGVLGVAAFLLSAVFVTAGARSVVALRLRRYFLVENLIDSRAEPLFHYQEQVLVTVEDVEQADSISVEEFSDESRYPRGTRIGIPS